MSDVPSTAVCLTRVFGPIAELPDLKQSLLFAEFSAAAYYHESKATQLVQQMGFPHCRYFDRDGAQAYMFWNDVDCVVTCRGTEPNEWNDIRAGVNAAAVLTETFGRVHRGFNQEVDDLWPMLENALADNKKTLWFTGHSLGGAMATICAGRCYLSEIESMPQALFTFGCPRVGDKQFVNFVALDHTRWVNNNDIVTRVPPVWMGYRHGGKEWYLNRRGKLSKVNGWWKTYDRLRGFLQGLLRFQVDHFADHAIVRYIEHIQRAAEQKYGNVDAASPIIEPASTHDAPSSEPTAPSEVAS